MQSTYQSLIPCSQLLDEDDYDVLIDLYKKEKRRDEIVAKIFCDNYIYLINRGKKYISIEEEDKASFALESIHDALETHDGRDIKLITLIGFYYERKLKNTIEYQNREKRKTSKDLESTDMLQEQAVRNEDSVDDLGFTYKHNLCGNTMGTVDFNNSLLKLKIKESEMLSDLQKEICKLMLESNGTMTYREMGEELDISGEWVRVQLEKIKDKELSKIL